MGGICLNKLTDTYTLRNGVQIPCVGFGTWQVPDGDDAVRSVKEALRAGYRHIDTAAIYRNEESVGEAIRSSGVPRDEIFVTTKLWNTNRSYKQVLMACDFSLSRLGLDYLDLYLIHWPANKARGGKSGEQCNLETWGAMEKLCKDGKVRAIGMSNFLPHHLAPILAAAEIAPMVDQIEFHPGFMQAETVAYCREHGMLVEAWSPLGRGLVLQDPTLGKIARAHGKSPAQVCVRWCMQHGVLPLPKSVTRERIVQNAQVFDFELSPDEMAAVDALPELGYSGLSPDEID